MTTINSLLFLIGIFMDYNDKPYQLHVLSYDWMEPFGLDYFATWEEAEVQLKEYQNKVKVKSWRIFKAELLSSGP
jgi:hypothetical protein